MNVIPLLDHVSKDFLKDYLAIRGVKDINRYLRPDDSCFDNPFDYPNMEEAIDIFWSYIMSHEKIGYKVGIVMDSDMDGTCSAALMYLFCKELGITPKVFSHTGKQHGINDLIDDIIIADIDLLFIPDAGTNDANECMTLKENDIETIILDHHEVIRENKYATIVNHHMGNNLNVDLSGTGVTYKFVRAFCEKYNRHTTDYSDLVAVSIISDICNLTSLENRAYLNVGLNNPQNDFLKYMFEKCCSRRGVTPDGIGWDVSPLANALARSDEQETKLLFFKALIGEIGYEEALKDIRRVKRIQDNAVKEIVSELEPTLDLTHKAIVGFSDADNKSYLGLIANKFCGKYNKPIILLRELNTTEWTGSLRSPIDLANKINDSGLARAQGHEAACGITVKKSNLKRFAKWLDELDLSEKPDTIVTASISPEMIDNSLCKTIEENKILWGTGISSPTFHLRLNLTKSNVFVYKKTTSTLKVQIGNLSIMKFFASEKEVEDFMKHENFTVELIVGDCKVSEYNGVITPQCSLIDYEITPVAEDDEDNFDWEDIFI